MEATQMEPVFPFRLIGETDRQRIAAECNQRIRAWVEAWFPDVAAALEPVELNEEAANAPGQIVGWWMAGSGADHWVALEDQDAAISAFSRLMLPGLNPGGAQVSALMAETFRACREDLVARLSGDAQTDLDPAGGLSGRRTGYGSGCVFLQLPKPLPPVWLACGGDVVAVWCRQRTVESGPCAVELTPRLGAIGRGRLDVEIKIGGAELSLGEVAQLAPGDVIVLDADITRPLEMVTPTGAFVAHGRLGRQGSKKAIQIETQ